MLHLFIATLAANTFMDTCYKDDEIAYTSTANSAVLISPTSMISNSSVPSSHSAQFISPLNVNSNNPILEIVSKTSSNGSLVSHSRSAHQLGHVMTLQQPHTPLVTNHQALQQQLQMHFASNSMGESIISLRM